MLCAVCSFWMGPKHRSIFKLHGSPVLARFNWPYIIFFTEYLLTVYWIMFWDMLIKYGCCNTNRSHHTSLSLCLFYTHTHTHTHTQKHNLNSVYWRWRAWGPGSCPPAHSNVKILASIYHFHQQQSQLFEEMVVSRAKARKIKHPKLEWWSHPTGHRSQLEEASTSQIWYNLSITINNYSDYINI